MRYPQTFIEDLRRQADIVRIVGDHVPLKKKGSNWMACCPFHKEKTPSFSVSPAKEIYYCFGCHKGGSVFDFVMEIERVSFPEAIKIVAEKSGVALPQVEDDSRFAERRQDIDEVIELNQWALEWWEQQLDRSSAEAKAAREYLTKREISEETRKTFRLGFAPDSWEALSSYLRQKGATQSQIERSGLVVKKDEGGSYDRFRARLIVPVMDVRGRPIAFGGRALKPDDTAKYINSPETAAYTKGRNLFGLHLTRDEIRRDGFAILVEGFLDLILPYQFGIRNVVASLGTALTPEQAKLLGRFARKVVVNYDGDRAGVQAAKKAIEILLAEDLEVKVLVLPDGADPDEFVRTRGAGEYQKHRGGAQPHIQFVIDQAVKDRNLNHPPEKDAAFEEVLPYIRAVPSPLQKREYFDRVMDELRIVPALRRTFWNSIRTPAASTGNRKAPALNETPTVTEEQLLKLLFGDEGLRSIVVSKLELSDYDDLPTSAIFRAVVAIEQEGLAFNLENLSQRTNGDPVSSNLLPMLLMTEPAGGDSSTAEQRLLAAEGCIDGLRRLKIERRIESLRVEESAAARAGDIDKYNLLQMEQIELTRRRNELVNRQR